MIVKWGENVGLKKWKSEQILKIERLVKFANIKWIPDLTRLSECDNTMK